MSMLLSLRRPPSAMPGCGEGSCRRAVTVHVACIVPAMFCRSTPIGSIKSRKGASGETALALPSSCMPDGPWRTCDCIATGLAPPALFAAWHQDRPGVTRRTSDDRPRSRHLGTRPYHLLTHRSCAMFRRCGHRAGVRRHSRNTCTCSTTSSRQGRSGRGCRSCPTGTLASWPGPAVTVWDCPHAWPSFPPRLRRRQMRRG